MSALLLALLLAPFYFLPLLIAWWRGLPPLSMMLITFGLIFLPGAGWLAGMYFCLADRPEPI